MTGLVAALQALGLDAAVTLAGHWLTRAGARYTVYVVETTSGRGYFT